MIKKLLKLVSPNEKLDYQYDPVKGLRINYIIRFNEVTIPALSRFKHDN